MKGKEKKETQNNYEVATFAGGCFWCMEAAFEALEGIEAVNGYAGGSEATADYETVSTGKTDHYEAIQIHYDPTKYTYEMLLKTFWRQIDPTDEGGQFADRGSQYKTAIFYHNEKQKELAEKSKQELIDSNKFDKPIVTEILPFESFFEAEEYHQDYHKKRAIQYKIYEKASGRKDYIEKTWEDNAGNFSENELKQKLTPLQYHVAFEGGTEKAFENEYHDEKRDGIYVDVVTGRPLFSSTKKYNSGTGWPSFTEPIRMDNIKTKKDFKLVLPRTEVKSVDGAHLGHVFNDGPKDAGGKRYCLNSASLRFVPKEKMKKEGYQDYMYLFE
ncbi:methionine sulfoxide reductase [archaeon D22]|nr:methionine sulfoxide reductase [archaeon D22]